MKKILIILMMLSLFACATKSPTTIEYDSQGNVVRTTAVISGKQYLELEAARAAEQSNSAYYASQSAKYAQLKDGRDIALVDAIAALSGNKNPTNYNDVLAQRSRTSADKWRAVTGSLKSIVTLGLPFFFEKDEKSTVGGGTVTVSDGGKANIIAVTDGSSFNGGVDGGKNGNNSFNEDNDTTNTNNANGEGSTATVDNE